MEPRCINRPPPLAAIRGNASRAQRNAPVTFVERVISKSETVSSGNGLNTATPALFTSTSRPRCKESIHSNARSTDVSSRTSNGIRVGVSATTGTGKGAVLTPATTCAPSWESRRAIAAPSPRPAPVTSASLPVRGDRAAKPLRCRQHDVVGRTLALRLADGEPQTLDQIRWQRGSEALHEAMREHTRERLYDDVPHGEKKHLLGWDHVESLARVFAHRL